MHVLLYDASENFIGSRAWGIVPYTVMFIIIIYLLNLFLFPMYLQILLKDLGNESRS